MLEEEVARRLERHLHEQLQHLLVERSSDFAAEVERRVEVERAEIERQRAEEAERKARQEVEAALRREVSVYDKFPICGGGQKKET
ncbi:unnamed protein product [Protopolystoma xenopodis]|uniref:Uncharacterized protein n=1 Tax=Protopolystoma xenopodis TaxID=117903 RepID=A0A3S5CS09_9PLAT|nr:unnamed protein product [Protopolystoma xenopodis]